MNQITTRTFSYPLKSFTPRVKYIYQEDIYTEDIFNRVIEDIAFKG